MSDDDKHPSRPHHSDKPDSLPANETPVIGPLSNYTLSTICPACGHPTHRYACKVRCSRCGFMWDCSEL